MGATIVGSPVARGEGPEKVTGRTLYAADVNLPGQLWGKILRSPYPHARIARVDISHAREVPGVKAIITGQEIRGHFMGKMIYDMPVLCWDVVRFVGDRVAAVAADSLEAAEQGLELIRVEYEELPAIFDPLDAMQANAVRIHEDVASYEGAPIERLALDVPNGLTRLAWEKGDIELGFREAELVLEHTFRIPGRHQAYIEPHAGLVAIGPDGRIQVWASTKQPLGTRRQLAKAIRVAEERIRVNVVNIGGDFGGKGDALDLTVAYFLAQKSGRPVKMVMTYAEELMAGNPAHPTVVTIRSGVKRDGRIVARTLRAVHASGAYGALKANASLSTGHYVGGAYRVDHASFEFLQVYTNTVPGGYYRGPGALATVFALESHTDMIAHALDMDPAEFRLKNFIGEGGADAIGQQLRSVRFREVLQEALAAAHWTRGGKPKPGCGQGIALFGRHIGGGNTGIILSAEGNGTITIMSPTFDQGTGTHTILRQLVAEEMQMPLDQVRVMVGDTDTVPYDGGVRASRMTYVAGNAVVRACAELRSQLLPQAARILECLPEEVDFMDGAFCLREDATQQVSVGKLVAQAGGHVTINFQESAPQVDEVTYICAQVAEVEVDSETGAVRIHRLVTAHDVGTVINPVTHQGQIEGGVIMGMGHTMMEELVMEHGRVINANLGDYKLPTTVDIPELTTVLVRSGGGLAPHDAKSIGELPNNSAAAAIANAVAAAVGARIFELPLTAEKIYHALRENEC